MKRIWNTPNFDPHRVINRWDIVIRSFQNSVSYFRVLSDTIIIAIPVNLSYGLIGQVFDLLLGPFIDSIKVQVLLRGAISYGTYYLSRLLALPCRSYVKEKETDTRQSEYGDYKPGDGGKKAPTNV